MKVSVYSFYCDSQDIVSKVEQSANDCTGVLFISKGERVVKICSTTEFNSSEGKINVLLS